MDCERCGAGLPDSAAICPACGTVTAAAWPGGQPSTNYGQDAHGGYDGLQRSAAYGQQPYGPQPGYRPPPQPNFRYAPQPNAVPPLYQPSIANVFVANNAVFSNKNNGPLIVEILLSLLLGVYGVGWLMAGETSVGIVLLIGTFFIYWPTIILGTIFTLGIGLLCLVPLALGAIVLNAVLLNNLLTRKAAQFVMFQGNQVPPRYPPYSQ